MMFLQSQFVILLNNCDLKIMIFVIMDPGE